MQMMTKIYALISLIVLLNLVKVHSHGHFGYPISRQALCKNNNDYNNGAEGIKDPGCRKAFEHVK